MFPLEMFADFLPLTMANKALQPDVNHDIVANSAPGSNQFR